MKYISFLFLFIIFCLISCKDADFSQSANGGGGLSGYSIDKRCVEGHVYFVNIGLYQGGIANKLTDDGKPIKCSVNND
jgi:hypothetical protein